MTKQECIDQCVAYLRDNDWTVDDLHKTSARATAAELANHVPRAESTIRRDYLGPIIERFTEGVEEAEEADEESSLDCGGQVCGDPLCTRTVGGCRSFYGIDDTKGDEAEARREAKPESFHEIDRDDLEFVPSGRTTTYKAYIHWPSREYWFVFPSNSEPFDIPCDEIQYLIRLYVHAGSGLTQSTVARRAMQDLDRDMTAGLFDKICKSLGIDKSSPPFAPHALAEEQPDDLTDVQRLRERAEAAVEQKMLEREPKALRKLVRKQARQLADTRHRIRQAVESAEITPLDPVKVDDVAGRQVTNGDDRPYVPILLLSDWHVGKMVRLVANRYDLSVAKGRVRQWLQKAVGFLHDYTRPIDQINIALLGDLIDGVGGNVYKQQWLDQDVNGRDQAVETARLVAQAIRGVAESTGGCVDILVDATPGNHGRSGGDRAADPQRFPEAMTYQLAKTYLRDVEQVEFEIHDEAPVARREFHQFNTTMLYTHGDRTPSDLRDLGWSKTPTNDRRIGIVSGHSHTDERSAVGDRHVYWQQNGALCGPDDFEEDRLGKAYRPSQSMVILDEDGPAPGPSFLLD